jgi:hypothetical protein
MTEVLIQDARFDLHHKILLETKVFVEYYIILVRVLS